MLGKEMLFNIAKESGMSRYYDEYRKEFFIPFDKAEGRLLSGMFAFLRNGWAMNVLDNGDNVYYVVFPIPDYNYESCKISICKDKLYHLLHNKCGVHYFTKMSMEEYRKNIRYQEAIDRVLEWACEFRNHVGNKFIAMIVNDKGELEFIEVS